MGSPRRFFTAADSQKFFCSRVCKYARVLVSLSGSPSHPRSPAMLPFMSRLPLCARAFVLRINASALLRQVAGIVALFSLADVAKAGPFPERAEILKQIQSVNAYFMKVWPDAGKDIGARPSN